MHGNCNYSAEVALRICEAVAVSTMGLRRLCEARPDLPPWQTIMGWRCRYPQFQEQYARAKELQVELMAEDILELADDPSTASGDVQRSKLGVETRKWLMSKLLPRKYGERIDVTSKGEALAAPSHQVDARVQSIVMQAAMRMQRANLETISVEALQLLD